MAGWLSPLMATGRSGAVPALRRTCAPATAGVRTGSPGHRNPEKRRIHDTDRKERIMPRLDLGAVRATVRTALRRLDTWTLSTLNSPAGGNRPR